MRFFIRPACASSTLVIGGAGYIGSHLVPMLQASGRQVTILGRGPKSEYVLPEGVVYVQGDLGSLNLLQGLLDRHSEVIHLAYATVPNTSFDNPLADLLQNLPSTLQLFYEVAIRNRKLLLVSSGGTVYGEAMMLPILENHPVKPISPYGVTKLTLENYAHLYSVTHGLRYVCVRPSNAYGVGQKPFTGQGFISTAIASSILGKSIRILGRNGTIRDYIYVSDLAAGIISALDQGGLGETYNLGSGVGMSNLEVIEAITPLMHKIGCDVNVSHLPERAFDVNANVLNSSKLQSDTGWSISVNLIDGLMATRDWLESLLSNAKN